MSLLPAANGSELCFISSPFACPPGLFYFLFSSQHKINFTSHQYSCYCDFAIHLYIVSSCLARCQWIRGLTSSPEVSPQKMSIALGQLGLRWKTPKKRQNVYGASNFHTGSMAIEAHRLASQSHPLQANVSQAVLLRIRIFSIH